jgi:hypothetical protein
MRQCGYRIYAAEELAYLETPERRVQSCEAVVLEV